MTVEELRNPVHNLKLMEELTEDLRNKLGLVLLKISEMRRVPKGASWLREKEHTPNKGYILVKGSAVVRKGDAPEIACQAPQLFGEMMQFNPTGVRTATVVTSEPCVVLRFLWDDFWAATEKELTPEENEQVRSVLQSLAWEHFMQ